MVPLHEDPFLEANNQTPLVEESKNYEIIHKNEINKKIMKTPCSHRFHINCLNEWMKIKLECPTCRKKLPSLD